MPYPSQKFEESVHLQHVLFLLPSAVVSPMIVATVSALGPDSEHDDRADPCSRPEMDTTMSEK